MIPSSNIDKKAAYGGKFVVCMAVQAMELMSVYRLDSINYLWRIKCFAISVSTFGAIEKAISTDWKLDDPLHNKIWLSDKCP
jgi:hypothetical protein